LTFQEHCKMLITKFAVSPLRSLPVRFLLVLLVLAGPLSPIAGRAQVLFLGVKTPVGSGFNIPCGTAVDGNGNVYVADCSSQAVYEIVASDGVVSSTSTAVLLAAPSGGYSQPVGVAVDKYGDVFVADSGTANAVDEIVAVNGVVNGSSVVNKLAGLPVFGSPNGLAVDGSGDLFVAYPQNGVVFEIVASGGTISTTSPIIALPAPSGGWSQPSGVAVDGSGDVFIADSGANALYEIPATGGYTTVSTIDTSTEGATTIAADRNGNVFFIGNFGTVLWEIPASGGYTTIDLLAVGFSGGNFFGITVDGHGNIFVADAANGVVDDVALDRVNFGSQAIGSPGETIAMPFNISLTGPTTLGKVSILTTGVAGKDFADAGSSTCIATTYSTSTNCVVNVSFTPLASGLRRGAVVFYDGSGNVLLTTPIYGVGTGPQVAFRPGTPNTLASGSFTNPNGVAVDGSGNVFVADSSKTAVNEIVAAGGYTTVTALGSGFSQPAGVAMDGSGNLFVADSGNGAVKEIAAVGGYTTVTTLGSGFSQPAGVALDGGGNVFVADAGNSAVYEILAAGGYATVNTLGSGFENPNGVAVDAGGNVFVADSGNSAVKEILAVGDYTTIKTLGSGFAKPVGVAVDGSGSVYVADAAGNAVYEIPAAGGYTTVSTLGSGFKAPSDVALDGNGNVFVADRGNFAVKKLDFADPPSLAFASTLVGTTSSDSPKTVGIQNIGNQALTLTGLSYPIDFPEGSGDASACTGSTVLSPAQGCDLPIEFTPQNAGSLSERVMLTDNALNATGAMQSIGVSGIGLPSPALTYPTPGSVLGTSQMFTWSTGVGVTMYDLALGTEPVSYNIYNSGHITGTSVSATGLPSGDGTIYATLWWYIDGVWRNTVYTFIAAGPPAILSPAPGSVLVFNAAFTWSPGNGATMSSLTLGTTGEGSSNLYNSGPTTATSANVAGIPTNSATIYAQLGSYNGTTWTYTNYTYTEAPPPASSVLISPTPGTVLGTSQTFTWSTGTDVALYDLALGTVPGSYNIYNSGHITGTSVSVTGLPSGGGTIYATLWWYIDGVWQYTRYTFTEPQ
jgi:sugar lactone lactonase YvrE